VHRLLKLAAPLALAALALAWIYFPVEEGNPGLGRQGAERVYHGAPYTGATYSLHANGRLHELRFYFRGRQEWKEFHWYPSGARWVERDFHRGLPHGEFRTWYENGAPKSVIEYRNGVSEGEAWAWNIHGRLIEYIRYEAGNERAHKSWTFDGKPYFNYVYQNGRPTGVQGGDFCRSKKL
jgi:hypothetical protein